MQNLPLKMFPCKIYHLKCRPVRDMVRGQSTFSQSVTSQVRRGSPRAHQCPVHRLNKVKGRLRRPLGQHKFVIS